MDSFTNFLLALITVLIGAIGYLLKRMFDRLDSLDSRFTEVRDDMSEVLPRLEILWQDRLAPASSPRKLNERGSKILQESGIKDVVDDLYPSLAEEIKRGNHTNPYDAEEAVIDLTKRIPEQHPGLVDRLKTGAYQTGSAMEDVLYVGSIYLRDRVFPELNFNTEAVVPQPEESHEHHEHNESDETDYLNLPG